MKKKISSVLFTYSVDFDISAAVNARTCVVYIAYVCMTYVCYLSRSSSRSLILALRVRVCVCLHVDRTNECQKIGDFTSLLFFRCLSGFDAFAFFLAANL